MRLFSHDGHLNIPGYRCNLLYLCRRRYRNVQSRNFASYDGKDERRMKIMEIGRAQELINMLAAARDDRTRKEGLKALTAISRSDEAVEAILHAEAISVIKSTPESFEHTELRYTNQAY